MLADALAALGHRVTFVLDESGMRWKADIAGRGHDCVPASAAMPDNNAGSLLDGYHFGEAEIASWRERSRVLAAVIDHQDIPRWAEVVVAPGLPAGEGGSGPAIVMAGLEYALVDPRFVRTEPRSISNKVMNVLVSFGQRDSKNATCLALDALEQLAEMQDRGATIVAALSSSAVHFATVEQRVRALPNVVCAADADMAKCYAQADLVIGGGGVGLLERMAAGLPSVSVVLAGNQKPQIALCAEAGGTLDAGSIDGLHAAGLADAIGSLVRSPERRAAMSAAARRAVDGAGARRVARTMSERAGVH